MSLEAWIYGANTLTTGGPLLTCHVCGEQYPSGCTHHCPTGLPIKQDKS